MSGLFVLQVELSFRAFVDVPALVVFSVGCPLQDAASGDVLVEHFLAVVELEAIAVVVIFGDPEDGVGAVLVGVLDEGGAVGVVGSVQVEVQGTVAAGEVVVPVGEVCLQGWFCCCYRFVFGLNSGRQGQEQEADGPEGELP